jgi:hypothetical protein
LYGTPLGSIEDSIVQKIEMQKMGIAEAQEKIDKWVVWNRILGIICGIHSVLVKANAIMAIVHWVGIGLKNYAPTTAAGAAIVTTSSIFDKFIVKWIHKPGFPSLSFGTLLKWLCVIYSGKMCEGFTTLENEFIIKAREYGSEAYYDQYTNGKWGSVSSQQEQANKFKEWLMFTDWDPYKSIHTAANCLYIDAIIYNLRKERQINCMYTKCLEENAKIGLPTDICETQYKERECLYVDGAAWQAAGWIDFFHFVQLNLNSALANLDWWAYSISYFAICSPTDLADKTNTANNAANKATTAAEEAKKAADKAKEATEQAKEAADTAAKNANEAANKAKDAADKAQNSLDIYNALCHTIGSGVSLVEVGFLDEGKIFDFDFQANLEGTDYCVGYG